MCITSSIVGLGIGVFFTWFFAWYYYSKALEISRINQEILENKIESLENQNDELARKLDSYNKNSHESLMNKRFNDCMDYFFKNGSPENLIDTYDDLSKAEKAELHDKCCIAKKRRSSKNNPFRNQIP